MDESSKILDTSYVGLKSDGMPTHLKQKRTKLPKLKTQQNEASIIQSPNKTRGQSPTKIGKPKPIPPGYELAKYEKTIDHWNKMSYMKKTVGHDGQGHFQNFSIFEDLTDLKQYGLGIYFYMQFIKRLGLTCFIIAVLYILPLFLNYHSDGLSSYKPSFTLTIAKFTIGNLVEADQRVYLMQSACVVLGMTVLFGFYFHWRSFHFQTIQTQQKDLSDLDPTMYVVSIVGFDKKTPNLQQQLRAYFDTIYRGAYQVQVVHDFKRNFDKFEQLQQIVEKVAKEKQVLKQTDKSNEDLIELQKQLQQKQNQVQKIAQDFDPIYAIIHFRNLKSKYAFINVCRKYSLFNSMGSRFKRWLCCMPGLPQRLKFNKTDDLMIQSVTLPPPDGIAWNNIDITKFSYAVRYILSILFIAVSIFITSSCIALLTLYVTSSSNCASFDVQTTISQAIGLGDKLTIYCFCSANYLSIYTNAQVSALCGNIQNEILITNVMQIAASVLSTITNIILIVIVSIIAQKLLKPDYKPKEYNFIFVSVFLSNLINSTFLPLILNSDIFGFKSVSYLTFIDFINFDKLSIFKDFDLGWFAVISPYYTNFFLIASVSPLIQLVVYALKRRFIYWRLKSQCQQRDPAHPTIQKQADKLVQMFPFDLPTELSILMLQFFMCFMYACLIPLAIPIFTLGLILTFFCKRYIILNYTIRIPANQDLNQKVINLIPFIIVVQGLMGIWARTSDGVFLDEAFFKFFDISNFQSIIIQRAIKDIILLGATAIVLAWIIFDFTVLRFFRALCQICKDQLELPVTFAAIENVNYADRLRKTNIQGSYKLENNPVYKHAYIAYKTLMKRLQVQKKYQKQEQQREAVVEKQLPSQAAFTNFSSNALISQPTIIPQENSYPNQYQNPYQNQNLRQSQAPLVPVIVPYEPTHKQQQRISQIAQKQQQYQAQMMRNTQKSLKKQVQSPQFSMTQKSFKKQIQSPKLSIRATQKMERQMEREQMQQLSSHQLSNNSETYNEQLIKSNNQSDQFLKLNSIPNQNENDE